MRAAIIGLANVLSVLVGLVIAAEAIDMALADGIRACPASLSVSMSRVY